MRAQIKVPTSYDLKAKASASIEKQDDYVDRLNISTFDQTAIEEFDTRLPALEASYLKTRLERSIQARKNQFKPFEEQKMQFERNKDNIERRKQDFYEKLQSIKVIIALVGLLLMACGAFAYIFQAPQIAVSAGGQIRKGDVDKNLYAIGGTLIAALSLGVVLTIIGLYSKIKN